MRRLRSGLRIADMGVSQNCLKGSPYNKDYSILGGPIGVPNKDYSILEGPPICGKHHIGAEHEPIGSCDQVRL